MINISLKLLIITLLLSLNVIQASTSIQILLTENEKQFLQEHPTITLGTNDSWPPYSIKSEDGTIIGYDQDILNKINKATGANFVLKQGNWIKIQQEAKDKKIDGLATAIVSKEREEYLNFSNTYESVKKMVLVKHRNPLGIYSQNDLVGKTIAVQKGNVSDTNHALQIIDAKIIYTDTPLDALKEVMYGKADITFGNLSVLYILNQDGVHFIDNAFTLDDSLDVAFSVRKDFTEAISILNKGLSTISDKDKVQLKQKWFTNINQNNKIQLSKDEVLYLKKKKEITMCFDPNWMPYEKYENNKYTGINSEYIKIFEQSIGIPIRPIKTTSWKESIEFAKKRKCDILSLLKETPSRKKYLNFTTPYLNPSVVLVTKPNVHFIDDVQQLKTEKIGVVQGYASREVLLQQYPDMKIIDVENIEDGLKKVVNGELFGLIDALPTIAYRIQGEFIGQLKISAKIIDKWEMGIGVRDDDLTLLNILNKAIERLPKNIQSTILNKYIGIKYEKRFDYTLFWQIFAVFTAFIVFLYIRYYIINNYNKKMKKYLYLIDNNFLSSSTDKDGNITKVSEALCRTTGYSEEELIGKNHNIFRHKDMPNSLFKEMWETILSGKEWRGDIKNLNKDGSYHWADTKITPIFNKDGSIKDFNALRFDITDRKKLKSAHDMLSKLTQNIPGFTFQYKLFPDGHANIPYSSSAIEEIFELKANDVVKDAQAILDIIYPDDLNMVKTSIQDSAQSMNIWNIQYRVNLPKKGLRWLEGLAKPERLEDASVLWHGHIHDITDSKRKDELMIAQSRNAAKGEMVGMIAHQWRQPLATISMTMNNMLVDIELDTFDVDTAKSYAGDVLEQNQHLSNTIDDFGNFFKPDKDISKVKIPDVLEQTYSIIKDSLANNNIELKKSYESESQVDVYPRELMQVFVNIIQNAKDTLLLNHIDDASIQIKVYENEKEVITDIYDNGGGIDEEVLPKIFDPYFSTKDEKNGTGIGLYMSKMIIENHLHGTIEAFNTDSGACVRVVLNKETGA